MKERMKRDIAITLVALVITIVILLILAGITISQLTGSGMFEKAKQAEGKTKNEQEIENFILSDYEKQINNYLENNKADLKDGSWNGIVNTPKIDGTGLIPVYWDESISKWIELTDSSSQEEWQKWYNYENCQWANAVTKDINGNITGYWVWIPRYEYQIDSTNRSITARFISTEKKNGATGYTTDSTTRIISSSDNYIIHPAFIDDTVNTWSNGGWDSELPGLWIAKYEAGYQYGQEGRTVGTIQKSTLKYTSINSSYTNNFYGIITANSTQLSYPVFTQETYSYNLISAGDAFVLSQEIDGKDEEEKNITAANGFYGLTNVNSHMMKNSEWGAIAYLTHSQYGVNGNTTNNNKVTSNKKKRKKYIRK